MNEKKNDMLSEMFGEMVGPESEKKKDDAVIHVDSEKMVERPIEGTVTPALREEEHKDGETSDANGSEGNGERTDETHDDASESGEGCDPKLLVDAKKELGIGGAAFCDELMATCPDVFGKLKDAGKTLHGFFNFAYSYALDEYVKRNGRQNGGGYWNLAELAAKYLDPSVKEGFTVKEPKAKKHEAPKMDDKVVNTVASVAKKAAKDAKRAAKKTESKKTAAKTEVMPTAPKPGSEPINTSVVNDLFAGVDLTSL